MPIVKNFYQMHPNVANRPPYENQMILDQNDIKIITGENIPPPIAAFEEACFPPDIWNKLKAANFERPTAIQVGSLFL